MSQKPNRNQPQPKPETAVVVEEKLAVSIEELENKLKVIQTQKAQFEQQYQQALGYEAAILQLLDATKKAD